MRVLTMANYFFLLAMSIQFIGCDNTTSSYEGRYYWLVGFLDDSLAVLGSNRTWTEVTSTLSGDLDRSESVRGAIVLLKFRGNPQVVFMDSTGDGYDAVKKSGTTVWAFHSTDGAVDQWDLQSRTFNRFKPTLMSDGCAVRLRDLNFRPGEEGSFLLLTPELASAGGFLDCALGVLDTSANSAVLRPLGQQDSLLRGMDDAMFWKNRLWRYTFNGRGNEVLVYAGDSMAVAWPLSRDYSVDSYSGDTTWFSNDLESYWSDGCIEIQVREGYNRHYELGGMRCISGERPVWDGSAFVHNDGTLVSYEGVLP